MSMRMIKKTIRGVMRFIGLERFCGMPSIIRAKLACMKKAYNCKVNYNKVLKRLRAKSAASKIRVIFIVSEPSKWKCQKLYEALKNTDIFEPMVGLSAWNMQSELSDDDLEVHFLKAESFFDKLGDIHVRTVKTHPRSSSDLSEFSPDIIIYNEQWRPCWNQTPEIVSRFAITCFIPYYVPDFASPRIDCQQEIEQFSFAYFTMNNEWNKLYQPFFGRWTSVAKLVPCGHPALDFFCRAADEIITKDGYVIYAPHFSIKNDKYNWYITQGTSDWNGQAILEYAQKHPEIKWAFKPHPLLKREFIRCGYMTREEVDAYYTAWEGIALCCYDGDYQGLFLKSRAMITDCGSFLAEYGSTGRPLIHLWSCYNDVMPPKPSQMLWDCYYRAENLKEMFAAFELVLERNKDPKRNDRIQVLRILNMGRENASGKIVAYLRDLIKR